MSRLKCCKNHYNCDVDCKVSEYQNDLKERETFHHISELTFVVTNRTDSTKNLTISNNPAVINETLEEINDDTAPTGPYNDTLLPQCHTYSGPQEFGGHVGPSQLWNDFKSHLRVIPPAKFVTCLQSEMDHYYNCKRNKGECSLKKPTWWPNTSKGTGEFPVIINDDRILCANYSDPRCTKETINITCGYSGRLWTTFDVSFVDFPVQDSTEETRTTPQTLIDSTNLTTTSPMVAVIIILVLAGVGIFMAVRYRKTRRQR